MTDPMSGSYRKTRYGWEPRGVWDKPLAPIGPPPRQAAEDLISRLVGETVGCGVPLKSAVKYWDYILRHARPAGRRS